MLPGNVARLWRAAKTVVKTDELEWIGDPFAGDMKEAGGFLHRPVVSEAIFC